MAKMHKWRTIGAAHQKCIDCGATRWSISAGWGRAMLNGKPAKYCKGVSNDSK